MAIISQHGYRKIFIGFNHHLADSKGYAYEHRVIAEQKLGRRLLKGELVHHFNKNKLDNRPENLSIEKGNAYHYLHHRKRKDLKRPNESNPKVLCQCGCGEVLKKYDSSGRPRKFLPSHNKNLNRKVNPMCACGCGIKTEIFVKKFFSNHRFKSIKKNNNPEIVCSCGCGKILKKYDAHGRERRYISGHNMRGCNALLG